MLLNALPGHKADSRCLMLAVIVVLSVFRPEAGRAQTARALGTSIESAFRAIADDKSIDSLFLDLGLPIGNDKITVRYFKLLDASVFAIYPRGTELRFPIVIGHTGNSIFRLWGGSSLDVERWSHSLALAPIHDSLGLHKYVLELAESLNPAAGPAVIDSVASASGASTDGHVVEVVSMKVTWYRPGSAGPSVVSKAKLEVGFNQEGHVSEASLVAENPCLSNISCW